MTLRHPSQINGNVERKREIQNFRIYSSPFSLWVMPKDETAQSFLTSKNSKGSPNVPYQDQCYRKTQRSKIWNCV